ncbi:adenylyltransferase/cytidyltransferase family protein [Paraclostridium benzoelyticum]|uniref:adenylyltransferase/cytidyltransferase family protein n=1 Tax=Paraclostridium benzoelyticum TaxID=1629550 RepID=UPI0031CD9E3C
MKKYKNGYIAGVFDLFHIGHLNVLKNAKDRCDSLRVGVLSDELVEHFKGKKPYIPDFERMEIIKNIKCVDDVVKVTFENINKMDAWNLYHFDCLFWEMTGKEIKVGTLINKSLMKLDLI